MVDHVASDIQRGRDAAMHASGDQERPDDADYRPRCSIDTGHARRSTAGELIHGGSSLVRRRAGGYGPRSNPKRDGNEVHERQRARRRVWL